jgi:hypothetical protein
MQARELVTQFGTLRVWAERTSFTCDDWDNYLRVAGVVQQTSHAAVEAAMEQFVKDAVCEPFSGYLSESKLFLLMRVVFDLPEVAPQALRRVFRGWTNWPIADGQGKVSLAWPISWQSGRPELVASYEGAEGKPYGAVAEYRYFRQRFPFRSLDAWVHKAHATPGKR